MKKAMLIIGVAALAACGQQESAPAENSADANTATEATAPAALASINETSWEFTRDGKAIQESIDAKGNYIANSGDEHIDHGTAVMKDGKACFTSAMTDEGEVCWTDPMVQVGESGQTTSDKGETLTVKRVAYVPMTMPSK